ncbi:MAG: alpha-L-arabinofuranosidase [Armatimonadetes bacterium]|nr:alpha-L-arabinofuranosidase [Armatimonadota bacterium]
MRRLIHGSAKEDNVTPKKLSRRQFVAGSLATGVGISVAGQVQTVPADGGSSSPVRVDILTDEVIGTINPNIYGHFIEHLGHVIYDGIWVGVNSKIPNINGIRKELVEAFREVKPPIIRWPGGCFADAYHWEDGVGPRDHRPRRYGRWSDATEPNAFGTHEFMEFCRLVGAEPYFTANVGTGDAEEFQRWMEYCNCPPGLDATTLAEMRRKNGSKDPFRVKVWGIGNEAWGCGGNMTPEYYCDLFRRFTTWVPGYGVPLFFIGSGPSGNDLNWTNRFFTHWQQFSRAPIQGWSIHYYCGNAGDAIHYTEDQWYQQLKQATYMEQIVTDQAATLDRFDPEHRIGLVVDEWGAWHPAGSELNKGFELQSPETIRDALVAALTLNIFNRHSDRVVMASPAQLVNCLQSLFNTGGPEFVKTPNFDVFKMYAGHQGATALRTEIQAGDISFDGGKDSLPQLSGSASRKDGRLLLTVANVEVRRPAEIEVQLLGETKMTRVRETSLAAGDIHDYNNYSNPDRVRAKTGDWKPVGGDRYRTALPPASVNALEIAMGAS